jgi:hypothetical protein
MSKARQRVKLLFLGSLFDPEFGDYIFLRNVGHSPNYTWLHTRRPYSFKVISYWQLPPVNLAYNSVLFDALRVISLECNNKLK